MDKDEATQRDAEECSGCLHKRKYHASGSNEAACCIADCDCQRWFIVDDPLCPRNSATFAQATQPAAGECDAPPHGFVPCQYCHGARWTQEWAECCWPCLMAMEDAPKWPTAAEIEANPDWSPPAGFKAADARDIELAALRAQLATAREEASARFNEGAELGRQLATVTAERDALLRTQPAAEDGTDLSRCGGCGDLCVIWEYDRPLGPSDPCAWIREPGIWVFDCKNQDPRDELPAAQPNTGERAPLCLKCGGQDNPPHSSPCSKCSNLTFMVEADRRGEP